MYQILRHRRSSLVLVGFQRSLSLATTTSLLSRGFSSGSTALTTKFVFVLDETIVAGVVGVRFVFVLAIVVILVLRPLTVKIHEGSLSVVAAGVAVKRDIISP